MSSVFVMGTGMMTSVGLSAAETAASVRSRMMRFAEIDIRDQNFEPFKFAEIPEDGLPPLTEDVAKESGLSMREMRLLRVGTLPLLECLRNCPPDVRPPLLLALPDMETQRPLNRKRLLELLGRQTGLAFDIAQSSAAYSGRAGGLLAIAAAVQWLGSGSAPFVIAGGIESFRDLYVLGTLDLHKRVRSATTNDAFIPGEGAAFLLLAASPAALHAGSGPLARVLGCAESFEPGNLYSAQPYLGEGLANGLQNLLQTCGLPAPIEEVYSSMNGESHWAKEWGVAYTRNMAAFNPNHGYASPGGLLRGNCGSVRAIARGTGSGGNATGVPPCAGTDLFIFRQGPDRACRTGRCVNAMQTTFVNFLGIVHKGSNGMSIDFPDVCKTPAAPSPVPIPYPNLGQSMDTSQGPTTVTTDGQMPMVKGAQYSRSSLDEPGTIGGVLSSVNMNVCEFLMYSFDVKFEGNNVCRMSDPLWQNKKNIFG